LKGFNDMKTTATFTAFFVLLLLGTLFAAGAEREKNIYHAHKVSTAVVKISCDNGADPTVITDPKLRAVLGPGLFVSCGN